MNTMVFMCRDKWDDDVQSLVKLTLNNWENAEIDEEWRHELVKLGEELLPKFKI